MPRDWLSDRERVKSPKVEIEEMSRAARCGQCAMLALGGFCFDGMRRFCRETWARQMNCGFAQESSDALVVVHLAAKAKGKAGEGLKKAKDCFDFELLLCNGRRDACSQGTTLMLVIWRCALQAM